MTDGSVWPAAAFNFSVDLGFGRPVLFQEVTGMDGDPAPGQYRPGGTPHVARPPVPVPDGGGRVTLRRGIFHNDGAFRDFYNAIRMNTAPRRTVVITLLDERGGVKMTWTLNNAWPTKIASTDMESEAAEVAVDTLDLAYETMTVTPA